MTTLTILTPLSPVDMGDGITGYTPAFWRAFTRISGGDITAIPCDSLPTDPPLCVVRDVVTDAVAAAIAADPVWGPRILMEE